MPLVIQKMSNTPLVRRDARLHFIMVVFFLMGAVIAYRLFDMQVLKHSAYKEQAEKLHLIEKEIKPPRGSIYVKEKDVLYPIVFNEDYYLVFADPRKIKDSSHFIDTIAPILDLGEEEWKDLLRRINKKDDPYEPIKKKVSKEKIEILKKADIEGVYFTDETFRKYPEKNIGGHILGYVDYNGEGRYGLEGFYGEFLAGLPGKIRSARDAYGESITVGEREVSSAVPGKDLVLTIDRNIQLKTCEEIKKGVETFQADGGSIIVMDPMTGAVIAMCSFPDFDPEKYNTIKDIQVFNNPAIFYAYEPGSIFKTITMAIALDLKKISPLTTYEDTGEIKIIGQKPIKNFDLKAHGVQTMTEVLEKSLNTGAVYAENLIGKNNFAKYVKNFGFGENTGIGLDSESSGNILSLDKRGEIYVMTASFGQGITVTPMQYITAFSALINGGKLMKPYIVEKVMSEGKLIEETKPQIVRQVISSNASALISGMMVSVVEKGWDKKTKVQGYYVGGKTGTAQVADSNGKYGDKTEHSFAGFAPAYNPKIAVIVNLKNPKKYKFASETTTVVFRNLAEYILHYYNIPPDSQ